MEENYLSHYGVKGMKWGVIRTPEQLGHVARKLGEKAKSAYEAAKNREPSDSTKNARKLKELKKAKKNIRSMSDAEIRAMITRLENEKRLKELIESDLKPAKNLVAETLKDLGGRTVNSLMNTTSRVAGEYVEKKLKEGLGMTEKSDSVYKTLEKTVKNLELQTREAKAKQTLNVIDDYWSKKELEKAEEQARIAQQERATKHAKRKRR